MNTKWLILFILAGSALASCKVTMVGAYDQVTDQNIQKIQNDVSILLVGVEKNIQSNQPKANSYDSLKPSFITIEGEVKSALIRCNSLPKYNVIIGQLTGLQKNVVDLEKFSQLGIDSGSVKIIDSLFNLQFMAIVQLQNGLKSQK
jgi:hypothetical protein